MISAFCYEILSLVITFRISMPVVWRPCTTFSFASSHAFQSHAVPCICLALMGTGMGIICKCRICALIGIVGRLSKVYLLDCWISRSWKCSCLLGRLFQRQCSLSCVMTTETQATRAAMTHLALMCTFFGWCWVEYLQPWTLSWFVGIPSEAAIDLHPDCQKPDLLLVQLDDISS